MIGTMIGTPSTYASDAAHNARVVADASALVAQLHGPALEPLPGLNPFGAPQMPDPSPRWYPPLPESPIQSSFENRCEPQSGGGVKIPDVGEGAMSIVSKLSTQIAEAEIRAAECRDLANRGWSGPQNKAWNDEPDAIEGALLPGLRGQLIAPTAAAGVDDIRQFAGVLPAATGE